MGIIPKNLRNPRQCGNARLENSELLPGLAKLTPQIQMLDGRSAKPPSPRADPFYLSLEWRLLLDRIIAARGRRCEDTACATPHGPWSRIFGDHIVELKDGGAPLDPANILLRCGRCDARKTARTRAARMGIGA